MLNITTEDIIQNENTVIALGNFDGLHIGHQRLIDELKKVSKEKNLTSVLFSFFPHTLTILRDVSAHNLLTRSEKIYLLESMGIDVFIEYPFDKKLAALDPEDFVKEVLVKKMYCKVLIVGAGYRFGAEKKGTCDLLLELGKKYGIKVIVMEVISSKELKVSSSTIREYIYEKRFREAEKLLGRHYFVMGRVEQGKKIGRTIGFPTVNILPDISKLLPANGVYITKTHYKGFIYNSVTNIGVNPTVNGKIKTIETYMLEFEREIYGELIRIDFFKWIREEQKFEDLEALKSRLRTDVLETKAFFGNCR